MNQFRTSVLYGGNLMYFQYLNIDSTNIKFTQDTTILGLTSTEIVVPKKYVRKVIINNNIIGCEVTIYYCYPFQQYENTINIVGLKKEEGRKIKSLLL